ncbi:unnamed protein product [Absidia cylindrospora]
MNEPEKYCYLYTIVVRSPVTNKGVPVCFMLTSNEYTTTIGSWLKWIRTTINTNVQRIMIDCSSAEISAIKSAFPGDDGQVVSILLCHWHIKRAWEHNLKQYVKGNSNNETMFLRSKVRRMLDDLMYATSSEKFTESYDFLSSELGTISPAFVDYFNTNWYYRKDLWAKAFRLDAPFHTNNLIESYHNQLKTFYLGRSKKNRMDKTIYLLSQVVVLDYRQDALQVIYGVKNFSLTKVEKTSKNVADEIDTVTACSMIECVNENEYICKSFTVDEVSYQINIANNCVVSCSCPVPSGICKHMFLLSRIKLIPFNVVSPVSSSRSNLASSSASVVNDHDRVMDLKNKLMVGRSKIIRSLDSTMSKVEGNADEMEVLLDRMNSFLNTVDDVTTGNNHTSRQQ